MNWPTFNLGSLCTIARGSSPRPIKDERFFAGGTIPWIKIADATASGRKIFQTNQFVNELGASFSRRLQPGSLILPASGTLGIPRFLGVEGCIHDGWIYFADYKGIDPAFLYYKLITLKSYYEGIAYGAAIQNINTDIVRETEVQLPDIRTQSRIANILGSYDDLIENNQRRIKLLEEAARRLYREWFVALRFPGHERVKVVDGVPQGWERVTLTDIASMNESTVSIKNPPDTLRYLDISSVGTGVIHETTEYAFADAPGRARRKVKHGDTIWSCVRPNRRSYALIWEPPENLIASTGFAVLTPKTIPFAYLHLAATTDEFVGYLTSNATGAAYPAVTARDFESAELLKPSASVLEDFDQRVTPLLAQQEVLQRHCKTLQQARDALLPRLMSGALAV